MTTSLPNRIVKIVLSLAAACVLALTNLYAATGPNLLVNGDLASSDDNGGPPFGWTANLTVNEYGYPVSSLFAYPVTETGDIRFLASTNLGINHVTMARCEQVCPGGSSNSISQMVQGLVSGHQYQLSYYAMGFTKLTGGGSVPTGPIVASLGAQQAPPVPTPYWKSFEGWPVNWAKQTFTFDYKGASSRALLTLAGMFSGLPGWPCEPCTVEWIYFAKASLVDVTPTAPLLKVQKALGTAGRIDNADQFKVSIVNATTSAPLNSATTGGTGTSITGGLVSITGDTSTTYKVVEEMLSGSNSKLAQYDGSLLCTNATSGGTQFPTSPTPITQSLPLLQAGDDVTCTLTNTPKAPVLRLTKALGSSGRADPADQFITVIQERLLDKWSSPASTGNGNAINGGSTDWVTLALNTPYTLKEVMAANSGSVVTQYIPVVTCDNALAGSTTVVPSAPGAAFTPAPGDVLDCKLTNTRKPVQLRVSQRLLIAAPYIFRPPVDFTYTGNNGWVTQPLSVLKDNQVTTGALQTLTAPLVQTTLSATTTAPNWYVANYRCTDANAATSGNPSVVATSTTTSITIPANRVRAGALITCAMIQSYRQ